MERVYKDFIFGVFLGIILFGMLANIDNYPKVVTAGILIIIVRATLDRMHTEE